MRRWLNSLGSRLPGPIRKAVKRIPFFDRVRSAMAGRPALPGVARGERRAVVYLPTWARWDEMRQRPQYLLEAFHSAGHDVYFVDPREPKARTTASGVHIVPTVAMCPRSGVLLYVHFAPVRSMFAGFEDPVVVYDILDDLTIYEPDEVGLPHERTVAAHHPHVMAGAGVVMASSPVLAERHRSERSDIVLVANGVDVERFRTPVPRPTDIAAGGPVIGYHGAIAEWFDFDLVAAAAEKRTDWRFLFVGPVAPGVKGQMELLSRLRNVEVVGQRPSDAIAGYVQAFDVGTVPFVVTPMTQAVSPLKMFEYLAAGVPCVAAPLPACEDNPAVRIGADLEGFLEAVEGALQDKGDREWQALAAVEADGASWEHRLAPVIERLAEQGLLAAR